MARAAVVGLLMWSFIISREFNRTNAVIAVIVYGTLFSTVRPQVLWCAAYVVLLSRALWVHRIVHTIEEFFVDLYVTFRAQHNPKK